MPRNPSGPPARPASPLDALYQGPLDEFIALRKALAAALKREGQAEASAAALKLQKPSASAWAVNQVYWQARDTWNQLLSASDAVRGLQERMLAGHSSDSHEAIAKRQRAAHAVVERAVAALRDSGNAVTDATRQRIAVTVDAIAAYGSNSSVYVPGRLTTDLDPPGFAALASLGEPNLRLVKGSAREATAEPSGKHRTGRAAPDDVPTVLQRERAAAAEKRQKELRAAVDAAARELEAAQVEAKAAEQAIATARETADGHRRDIEAHRRTLAALEAQLSVYLEKVKAAEATRDARRRDVDAAAARLKAAQTALNRG
jgi:hypothetical protein